LFPRGAALTTTTTSRLYSEKAYVLSRGFVRRALEMPLGGLEPEIWYIYYANKLLDKVVCDARRLIDKSSTRSAEDGSILSPSSSSSSSSSSTSARTAADADSDLAVPRLTAGGIIALERTLTKLQSLLGDAPP
jgi:ubiquitin-conjugating enzyme E2 O